MLYSGAEMSLIFRRILGPSVLSSAPNHFVLGAQLDPGEKKLVCIPDLCWANNDIWVMNTLNTARTC